MRDRLVWLECHTSHTQSQQPSRRPHTLEVYGQLTSGLWDLEVQGHQAHTHTRIPSHAVHKYMFEHGSENLERVQNWATQVRVFFSLCSPGIPRNATQESRPAGSPSRRLGWWLSRSQHACWLTVTPQIHNPWSRSADRGQRSVCLPNGRPRPMEPQLQSEMICTRKSGNNCLKHEMLKILFFPRIFGPVHFQSFIHNIWRTHLDYYFFYETVDVLNPNTSE